MAVSLSTLSRPPMGEHHHPPQPGRGPVCDVPPAVTSSVTLLQHVRTVDITKRSMINPIAVSFSTLSRFPIGENHPPQLSRSPVCDVSAVTLSVALVQNVKTVNMTKRSMILESKFVRVRGVPAMSSFLETFLETFQAGVINQDAHTTRWTMSSLP